MSAKDTSKTAHVAADLRVTLGKLVRRLREEAHPGDWNTSQISVLGHLDREGPATVTSLARIIRMRPQSMSAIVASLETAGLVHGAPDAADRRQTILSLTPVALDMIAASRAAREDWLSNAIRTNLTPDEQDDLARMADLLKRIVGA
jgi:DNA-binding MarR family transcriptional regulator